MRCNSGLTTAARMRGDVAGRRACRSYRVLARCRLDAQRASAFDPRVKQFVVHDAAADPDRQRARDRRHRGTGATRPIAADRERQDRAHRTRVGAGERARRYRDRRPWPVGHARACDAARASVLPRRDLAADAVAYLSEPLSSPKAYLAYGATTIRTGGTFSAQRRPARGARGIRDGQLAGPEILVTAPFVEGEGGFAFQLTPITDPARARRDRRLLGRRRRDVVQDLHECIARGARRRRSTKRTGAASRSRGTCARSPFARPPSSGSTSSSTALSSPPISSPTRNPTSAPRRALPATRFSRSPPTGP